MRCAGAARLLAPRPTLRLPASKGRMVKAGKAGRVWSRYRSLLPELLKTWLCNSRTAWTTRCTHAYQDSAA